MASRGDIQRCLPSQCHLSRCAVSARACDDPWRKSIVRHRNQSTRASDQDHCSTRDRRRLKPQARTRTLNGLDPARRRARFGFMPAPEIMPREARPLPHQKSSTSIGVTQVVWQLAVIYLEAIIELLRRVALRILGTTYRYWRKVDSIKRFARLAVPHRQIQIEVDVRRPNVIWDLVTPQQPHNSAHVFHGLACVTTAVGRDLFFISSPRYHLTFF